jgi:hypothetical protein
MSGLGRAAVRDGTGAAVPGARIEASGSGATKTVTSDAVGRYRVDVRQNRRAQNPTCSCTENALGAPSISSLA